MHFDPRFFSSAIDIRTDLHTAFDAGLHVNRRVRMVAAPLAILLGAVFAVQRIVLGPDAPPYAEWLYLISFALAAWLFSWGAGSRFATSRTFRFVPIAFLRALRSTLPASARQSLILEVVRGVVGGKFSLGGAAWDYRLITLNANGPWVTPPFATAHELESASIVVATQSAYYHSGLTWMFRLAGLPRRPEDWVAAAVALERDARTTFDSRLMTPSGARALLDATGFTAEGCPAGFRPALG